MLGCVTDMRGVTMPPEASIPPTTLADRLAAGRMPLGEAIGVLDALTDLVGEGHRRGQVDGGLTPARVLLDGSRVRVGAPAGTPEIAFLSPQQIEGKPGDARADVFALGVIAYRAVTGSDPFGDTAVDAATRLAAIEKGPTDPAQYVPALTDHVRATLQIALARNLTERFADALTMRAALRGDSQVALDTPTLKWAVPEGAPPGEVTEGMAAFLSDAPSEPGADASGETNDAPED
jgi:hypothetical protein